RSTTVCRRCMTRACRGRDGTSLASPCREAGRPQRIAASRGRVYSYEFALRAREGSPMAGRNFLFVPGPTNVPDRIQRAMVVAMEDHRSSRFPELTLAALGQLKKVFKTESGTPMIFP